MAQKFYVIKEGFDARNNERVENKLVRSWDECKKLVVGVKGAKYKSFESIGEANEYLNGNNKLLKKGIDTYPLDWLQIYVDGSYNAETERFSYAFVAVRNNIILEIENGMSEDKSQKQIRQIAGELKSVIRGLEYAIQLGEKKVVIIHDYEGIYHHAVGTWKRTDISSQKYYDAVNKLITENSLEIIFVKVDSHTGDLFNELVDEKCKEKLSIQSDKSIEKWLLKNTINVNSEEVKQEILKIAPDGGENIMVIDSFIRNEKEFETNKFNLIACEYNLNPGDVNSLIDKLNSKEQMDFIIYLLERIRQI